MASATGNPLPQATPVALVQVQVEVQVQVQQQPTMVTMHSISKFTGAHSHIAWRLPIRRLFGTDNCVHWVRQPSDDPAACGCGSLAISKTCSLSTTGHEIPLFLSHCRHCKDLSRYMSTQPRPTREFTHASPRPLIIRYHPPSLHHHFNSHHSLTQLPQGGDLAPRDAHHYSCQ